MFVNPKITWISGTDQNLDYYLTVSIFLSSMWILFEDTI